MEDLYNAFSQESEGYTKKYQGIGLGMAITKRHLDLNNVDIDVKSTKGVGTTFTLTFKPEKKPLHKKKQIKQKEVKDKPTAEVVDKSLILLVEDDTSSQKLTEFFLKKQYNICFAVSVDEAQQQLKKYPVDLILLDLSLIGNEDGLDLVRWMRKSKTWKKTPVIATTAHAFTTDQNNCIAAGCNDYLPKPIKREKLLEKISEFV
jgi:CheY-like chemotaxis protein